MSSRNAMTTGAGSKAKVIIISSVMFAFISYWRVAAIVLCDLASTAYYIGGIVEHSIGPAAPWFIVGVMLFSYAVRSVYIESCSMYVRGGVYKIVKEALGRTLAKFAVSALLFDYVLTGPISGVSAGQYIMSLLLEVISHSFGHHISPQIRDSWKAVGSVLIACAVTIYFYRLNVMGIHESSDKALKIMIAMTVMGSIMLVWCLVTLAIEGPRNPIPFQPTFISRENPSTGQMESPLGFLEGTSLGNQLAALSDVNWWSLIGVIGFFLAFGHSVLAMSGEETLAQIYREVESPKLKNFQKAALIVFVYSLVLTGGISLLAVALIPDEIRMSRYADNLIGGLAMNVYGPMPVRLALNGFVVVVGSLILAGAVNTAIIGSNGVLNRVAEDGVIPEWFLSPHPRFGTTHRMLNVILGLQLFTILASRGDVLLLGEAYAFGVVWSFVFNSLAMLVLRFKDPDRPRGFKVPLNLRLFGKEIPIGLGLIFLVLLISAIMNFLTKEMATTAGLSFTIILFILFAITEHYRGVPATAEATSRVDQYNEIATETVVPETLGLKHRYRRLVAIRSPRHLDGLEKILQESDPDTTDVVTLTAQIRPVGGSERESVHLDTFNRELVKGIEKVAELTGKSVIPIIVSTNNSYHAVLQTTMAIGAQEVIAGPSESISTNQQFDKAMHAWKQLHHGQHAPLTMRIIGGNRDLYLDIDGGNRIPNLKQSPARSIDELRAAGKGVDRVLMLHDGTEQSSQIFQSLMTMLDPRVSFDVLSVTGTDDRRCAADCEEARRLRRVVNKVALPGQMPFADELPQLVRDSGADVVVARQHLAQGDQPHEKLDGWIRSVLFRTKSHVLLSTEISGPHAPD